MYIYFRIVSEKVLLNPGYSTNFIWDLYKEKGEKLSARTVVSKFLITNKNIQMTSLEKNRFQKETKKEGVFISVLNFFLPIFPL